MQQILSIARPYPPSFVDRLMDSVERLPIPYWLTYTVLFCLQSIIFHILGWIDGWLAPFTFSPLSVLFPLWLWAPAIMTHVTKVSIAALASFRPLLHVDETRLEMLRYKFSAMPARDVILSSLFWGVAYAGFTYLFIPPIYIGYGIGRNLAILIILEGLVSYTVGGTIYYYSLRQLRLVNETVKLVEHFNLFRLEPVYAFSRVTSQIGIAWMLLLTATVLLFPIQLAPVPTLALLIVQTVLAIAAFVLPLWFVNRRLVAEKRRLMAEHRGRVEGVLERLHRHVDGDEMDQVPALSNALEGLHIEREELNNISTWPWRPATLTGFVSAIVLPLVLFLVQLMITRWLAR